MVKFDIFECMFKCNFVFEFYDREWIKVKFIMNLSENLRDGL